MFYNYAIFDIHSAFDRQESELDKTMSKKLSKLATRDFLPDECKHIKRIGGKETIFPLSQK